MNDVRPRKNLFLDLDLVKKNQQREMNEKKIKSEIESLISENFEEEFMP